MSLTNLTNTEKLASFIYIANHELSTDKNIKDKQYEVLRKFLASYIKEYDYFSHARNFVREKYSKVYTPNWNINNLTIEECDRILSEINYRTQKYKDILKALIDELAKTQRPTGNQLKYVDCFTKYHED